MKWLFYFVLAFLVWRFLLVLRRAWRKKAIELFLNNVPEMPDDPERRQLAQFNLALLHQKELPTEHELLVALSEMHILNMQNKRGPWLWLESETLLRHAEPQQVWTRTKLYPADPDSPVYELHLTRSVGSNALDPAAYRLDMSLADMFSSDHNTWYGDRKRR